MTADTAGLWLPLLRDLSVKSALLLLSAWALTLAMRRASASARHLVWLLVFAGLLALPLLSLTLPARPVPVLPAVPVAAVPAPIAAPPEAVPESLPAPSVSTTSPAVRPVPPAPPVRLPFLCLLWLGGAVLFSAPVALGLALAGRRIRRCRPVADPVVLALAAEAARRLGVRRPVALRSGPSVSVPVTFGLIRPVILLPDGAASWPAERLRVALLHELAHVKRGDWAAQTAARLVCALFWHNPLVWPAARMLRAEAERACDDLVLSSGVPAPDYAQHLLAVAAALSGTSRPLPLAVPMAGRGPLESRLRAVLSVRPRRALSRPRALFAFVLALFVLVPLAALRPAARAALRAAPLLPPAPAIIPAAPKAIRRVSAPVKAAVAAPPAPTPAQSTSIGVPPMKTLTPAKAIALAALAATLALPAAQAKPTAPVKHVSASALATRLQYEAAIKNLNMNRKNARVAVVPFRSIVNGYYNPASSRGGWGDFAHPARSLPSSPPVTLDLKETPIRQALDALFASAKVNYTVAAGVPDDKDVVTVHLTNIPLAQALEAVLAASDTPLTYTVGEGGIIAVAPGRAFSDFFRGPSRAAFTILPDDGAVEREQEIARLLVERATKIVGGVTPQHPDVLALDARIAELQRRERAAGMLPMMKRKLANPVPDKAH